MIRPSNLSGRNTLARSRRLIVSIETFHRSANSRLVNNESSIVFTKSFVCIVRSQALALQKGKPLRPAVRAFQGRSTKTFLDIHNTITRSNYNRFCLSGLSLVMFSPAFACSFLTPSRRTFISRVFVNYRNLPSAEYPSSSIRSTSVIR
jgi:hypothetical protein